MMSIDGDIVDPSRPEDHRGEKVDGLPHGPPAPRHVFDEEKWVPAPKTLTGLNQTERVCSVCGVIKVTVHEPGGGARREWRLTADSLHQSAAEIVCLGMIGQAR